MNDKPKCAGGGAAVSDETYYATPLGVLMTALDDASARTAIDALALYMRRHCGETPGIVLDCSELRFVELVKAHEAG